MPDRTATAVFSHSGTKCVPVIVTVGEDVLTDFGPASGPAICPPEIDYPVTAVQVAAEFPFPVWLLDTRLDGDTLYLGLDRLDDDDDWADMAVVLDQPCDHAELQIVTERGRTVEVQVTITGAEPIHQCGALYERQSLRRIRCT